jgi:hypothetical protein
MATDKTFKDLQGKYKTKLTKQIFEENLIIEK